MINKACIEGDHNIVIQDADGSTITIDANNTNEIQEKLKQLNKEQLTAVQQLLDKHSDAIFNHIRKLLQTSFPDQPFPKNLTAYTSIAKENIVGREKDLEELRRRLLEDNKLSLINGMGGIGKTTLAAVYLNTYKDEYVHIAWLTIETSLEDAIIANHDLLTNLKLQDVSPEELLNASLNQLRNLHSSKPNLLVLDNATERLAKLYDHLPKAPHWHVLVTSREMIELFSVMELGFLTEEEAIALFQKHNSNFNEEETRSFVQDVECHTLTIEILAKSAKKNRWNAEKIKQAISLDEKAGIATSHSGHEKIDRITSYLIQIFQLSSLDEQEKYILKQFTALPNQWIGYDLLTNLLQVEQLTWKEDFPGTLEDLYEKGYLLKDKDSYKMHPVLVEALSPQLKTSANELKLLIEGVAKLISYDQDKDSPIDKSTYIPFGDAILQHASVTSTPKISVLQNDIGMLYYVLGQYEQARDLLEDSLNGDITSFGETHPRIAIRRSNLGLIYKELGEFEKARELFEKALLSDIVNFGAFHAKVAMDQAGLGLVYHALGRLKDAEILLNQTLEYNKTNLGEKHPAVASDKSNLGLLYADMGQFAQAKNLLEEALLSDIANFGEKHPNVAIRQSNLGTIHHDLGEYEKALDLLDKALISD
ncbi:tetratricopeptide (TPR) repeat protein [Catalinimonas alkaloidigena]|uniref:tetratricopeptide repeat protein n=1 Tax=Catalinimonas alkaloidigena TaxID=1075417 RepID=UPI002405E5FC|nr:tetratricopeptide repeat protein [Catalinimonas alkaloidigena]MDF9799017.1 tetratricopeptide (TPR) repeat protein [Catalinimonas alkaloidigena]